MKKLFLTYSLCLLFILVFGQIEERQAIDSIFSEWDKADVPGCALGIIKDNRLVYARGYGSANLEYDIPNSASSVFRIASTSKQFTAACIILLAEKGKLDLNDHLKSLFPDFPDYAEKITIRHLLNHTSGIRDYLQLAYLKGLREEDYYLDEDIMQWLINQTDLNFNPGEDFLYSNSGYWLLGQIVNKVAGMTMAEFAKQEIFDPLGMKDTHFHNDHTQIVKNRASGYVPDGNGHFKISMTTLDMIGDGGIFTTINDIKKWDDAYYDSSFSPTFWKEMTQQGVLNNGEVIDYASGLMIGKYKGLKTIRHGGAFVGFRAELLRFPEEKLSIAIFANRGDAKPSDKANQVATLLLEDKLKDRLNGQKKTLNIEEAAEQLALQQLVGTYEVEPGFSFSLSIRADSLNVLQNWNKSTYNIVNVGGNTYQIPGQESISFTFSNLKDEVTERLIILQNGSEIAAKRKKEIDTAGIHLEDYLGSFYSKELDVSYHFKMEKGKLKVVVGDQTAPMDCTISEVDQFTMSFGLVRFQRMDKQIIGFELDSGRVKNVRFHKIG